MAILKFILFLLIIALIVLVGMYLYVEVFGEIHIKSEKFELHVYEEEREE